MALPTLVQEATLRELSRTAAPATVTAAPSLLFVLIDVSEARTVIPVTDSFWTELQAINPLTETLEPNLAKDRRDSELPKRVDPATDK